MNIFNAILFGLIQGITEYFPISSSAHLAVFGNLFGVNTVDYNYSMFSVFAHFGTIMAAIIVCWNDFADMIYEIAIMRSSEHSKPYYNAVKTLYLMIISCIPLISGIFIINRLNSLYSTTWFLGVAVILNGVLLFIADHFPNCNKGIGKMTALDALVVGIAQICSIFPGISRTGTVLCSSMAVGLKKDLAYKYALLLSIPAALGANILQIFSSAAYGFEWNMLPGFLVGTAASLVSGILIIKLMQKICNHVRLSYFAYYCWVAGVLFIILTMIF